MSITTMANDKKSFVFSGLSGRPLQMDSNCTFHCVTLQIISSADYGSLTTLEIANRICIWCSRIQSSEISTCTHSLTRFVINMRSHYISHFIFTRKPLVSQIFSTSPTAVDNRQSRRIWKPIERSWLNGRHLNNKNHWSFLLRDSVYLKIGKQLICWYMSFRECAHEITFITAA